MYTKRWSLFCINILTSYIVHCAMSHAKEIRHKKELQAKFSIAVSNTSSLVSSWLKPSKVTETVEIDASKSDFLNLPIIAGSSGLSLSTAGHEDSDINTIGDYVKTGKSLKTLSNKKNNAMNNGKIQKNPTQSSKALNALRNKLKKQEQVKRTRNDTVSAILNKPSVKQQSRDDSDSEDEVIQKSAPKKSFGLLIDSKIKKKR